MRTEESIQQNRNNLKLIPFIILFEFKSMTISHKCRKQTK